MLQVTKISNTEAEGIKLNLAKRADDVKNSVLNQRIRNICPVYFYHPDRQTILGSIGNFFGEMFKGKTAVKIQCGGEGDKAQIVYVRVVDLEQWGIKSADLKKVNDIESRSKLIITKLQQDGEARGVLKKFKGLKQEELKTIGLISKDLNRTESDIKYLELSISRIGVKKVSKLIKKHGGASMLNTLIAMGKTIETTKQIKTGIYAKREKPKNSSNETYAYALTETHSYICLSKGREDSFLGKGAVKLATVAFEIGIRGENASKMEKVVRLKAHESNREKLNQLNDEILSENEITKSLEDGGFAVKRFNAVVFSKIEEKQDKAIAFQKSYTSAAKVFDPANPESFNLPVSFKLNTVVRIGLGLDHIHKKGLIHSDVKLDNILLDENREAFLTDFGGVVKIGEELRFSTIHTLPPEALFLNSENDVKMIGIPSHPKIDAFSYGMLLLDFIEIDENTLTSEEITNGIDPTGTNLAKILYGIRETGLGAWVRESSLSIDQSQEQINIFFDSLRKHVSDNNTQRKMNLTVAKFPSDVDQQNKLLRESENKYKLELILIDNAQLLTLYKQKDRFDCGFIANEIQKEAENKGLVSKILPEALIEKT